VNELSVSGKPFDISKWEVWEAWGRVKAVKWAPGVDGRSIENFEKDLKTISIRSGTGYSGEAISRLRCARWKYRNRMAGAPEFWGVPTVADRVAQAVAARRPEARAEPAFHSDS
jgi:RNA-directed DNA polymerase